MKQYCRYCLHLHVNDFPYCSERNLALSVSSCKRQNKCTDFVFVDCEPEYQDALMENDKGYKPRTKKETQLKGQMSFADLESDS